jgi:hypothetical protein
MGATVVILRLFIAVTSSVTTSGRNTELSFEGGWNQGDAEEVI